MSAKGTLCKCDHIEATCPSRCKHLAPHAHNKGECKRGICGGQHVECKPVESA